MKNSMMKIVSKSILPGLFFLVIGCQPNPETNSSLGEQTIMDDQETVWTQDEWEIIHLVERFLTVAGNYDLEAMDEMISDKANLGIGRIREGKWTTSVITIEEYFEGARNRDLSPYFEPVNEYIIHINEGQIAFVWADATLYGNGIPRTRNIDNFTLIKVEDKWEFLNLSFTTNPLPAEERIFDLEMFAKSYAQAWSGSRPDFVAAYFAENGSLRVNEAEPAIGRAEISKVAEGFMTALPDMVVRFDSLVSKTDGTAFYWTLSATNSGPGGTGNKVKVSGFELWQLDDNGFIKESQGSFPTDEYNRQLEFGIQQ